MENGGKGEKRRESDYQPLAATDHSVFPFPFFPSSPFPFPYR